MAAPQKQTVPERIPQPHGGALRPWLPGQSGNPGGVSNATREAIRLAKETSPRAMAALIAIMDDPAEDTRARIVAAVHVLDRALGRPKDKPPDAETKAARFDFSRLTSDQLRVLHEALLAGMVEPDESGDAYTEPCADQPLGYAKRKEKP